MADGGDKAKQLPSMAGKVCLITGASGGIGSVTAEALAQAGADVVMVGRNPEKTEAIARQIREATGNSKVEVLIADLSKQAEVRKLAQDFRAGHDRLDVLINNAGALFMGHEESADGIEMTFALNHLAYFLLTNLLIDLLVASAPARIINVSSAAHNGAKIDIDEIRRERGFSGWKGYGQSKLANLYFTYELARRMAGTGSRCQRAAPRLCRHKLWQKQWGLLPPALQLVSTGRHFTRKRRPNFYLPGDFS